MAKRVRNRLTAKSPREVREPAPVQIDPRQLEMLVAQIRGEVAVNGPTFKEMADAWMQANSARLVCPANEFRHVRHLKSLWEMRETELSVEAAQQALSKLLAPHGPLGPSTLNKVRATAKRIVELAKNGKRWLGPNPFASVKRSKENKTRRRTLTPEQLRALLPFLRPDRRRLVRVAFLLGARPGELLGMQKEDVDFQRGVVTIRRSHSRATTKTGAWREVPLTSEVEADLREAVRESPSKYVFPKPNGDRQRRDTKLSRTLRVAMVKAGLVSGYRYSCRRKGCGHKEERPELESAWCPTCDFKLWAEGIPLAVVFYGLRHSAATQHRRAGADPLAIKLTLGHTIRDVSDSTYTHMDEDQMRAELSKLSLRPQEERNENQERRTGFEPATPSLGRSGRDVGAHPEVDSGRGFQPLLTVAEVAELTQTHEHTVRRLAASGKLPSVRLGKAVRFHRSAIEAFLQGGGAR